MLSPRSSVEGRRAESFPEDSNYHIAVGNAKNGVDEALRSFKMETRVGVRFPARQLKPDATVGSHTSVDLCRYAVEGIAFPLYIAGRDDDDTANLRLPHTFAGTIRALVLR